MLAVAKNTGKSAEMKPRKESAHDDFKELLQINVLILQLSGLIQMEHIWGSKLVSSILSVYAHICYFFLFVMYVLSVMMGHYDAGILSESVALITLYCRHIILYSQRHQLAELLRGCRELWVQLTESEKHIVR